MKFLPEPPHRHGTPAGIGILLCNLGTPEQPTPTALRRYLAEFLSDPRVVEIPAVLWRPILHGIILRRRPAVSARKYASIWTPEGSPLKVWTDRQALGLEQSLLGKGHPVHVVAAMRYGSPSIAAGLGRLKAVGVDRILILPLYPQYAAATTASVIDAVGAWARATRHVPEMRFVNQYHDDAGYIDALTQQIKVHWTTHGRGETLVMSFHGLPRRSLDLGDPYFCHCHKTARLLAERLELSDGDYRVTFQSRFGRARWLEPYTEPTLRELAGQGVSRVDVVCPGFVADCLETLEEIAQEGRDAFLTAGGKAFHYIDCLNAQPAWIEALASIALRHLQGWPTAWTDDTTALQSSRGRALAMGAPD